MSYHGYSDEEIAKLWHRGMTAREIAEKIGGVATSSVAQKIVQLRKRRPDLQLHKRDSTSVANLPENRDLNPVDLARAHLSRLLRAQSRLHIKDGDIAQLTRIVDLLNKSATIISKLYPDGNIDVSVRQEFNCGAANLRERIMALKASQANSSKLEIVMEDTLNEKGSMVLDC